MATDVKDVYYVTNDEGDATLFHKNDGSAVTSLEANVYPVGSWKSVRYNHPEGIVISVSDAISLDIEED